MLTFDVSYAITTEESAACGDFAESGYIEQGLKLRDAILAVRATRTNEVEGIEAVECDSMPCDEPRWITVYNGMEYRTGDTEQRTLHLPRSITRASARRVARIMGVKLR